MFEEIKYDYPQSGKRYKKPDGSFNLCACLGPIYGEPFCPCTMARKELPMSVTHVIESEAANERLKKLVEEGVFRRG